MSSLTANVLPKATDGTHIEDSRISDDGAGINIGDNVGPVNINAGNIAKLNAAIIGGTNPFNELDLNADGGGSFPIRTYLFYGDDNTYIAPLFAHSNILYLGDADDSNNLTKITIDDPNKKTIISADNGIAQSAPTSTTAGILANGQISFFLDELGNTLKVAVKYSDGTVKGGAIILT